MPNKIMFVDDKKATDPNEIKKIFCDILDEDTKTKLDELKNRQKYPRGINIQLIHEALKGNQFLEVFDSFEEAAKHISGINDFLSEYALFIFDRNLYSPAGGPGGLKSYDDSVITETLGITFTESYERWEGDFLATYLLSRSKPEDTITLFSRLYFYSAYNSDSRNEFAAKVKNGNFPVDHFIDKDDDGRKQLQKIIKDLGIPGKGQIRFKYRKIFDNQKNKNLLGKYTEDLIELLARIEYPDGVAGFKFEERDGTSLRNMIQRIVALLSQSKELQYIEEISVRNFLNNPKNLYAKVFYRPWFQLFDVGKEWQNLTQSLHHFPKTEDKPLIKAQIKIPPIKRPDKSKLSYLKEKHPDSSQQIQDSFNSTSQDYNYFSQLRFDDQKKDFIAEKIILYTAPFFLSVLTKLYFTSPSDPALPPKYIFSYIDNIYTVTSEWSAHGGNPTKVTDLSAEGFRALVYGMCQILDWLADKYPNQPDRNENNQ